MIVGIRSEEARWNQLTAEGYKTLLHRPPWCRLLALGATLPSLVGPVVGCCCLLRLRRAVFSIALHEIERTPRRRWVVPQHDPVRVGGGRRRRSIKTPDRGRARDPIGGDCTFRR
ncbi:hypothetical protein MRX96_024740 [Rhipicephalus microplus]